MSSGPEAHARPPDEPRSLSPAPAPTRASEQGPTAPLRRRLQTALGVRLLVGLVLLGGALAVTDGVSFTANAIFGLLVAVFATSLAFAVWLVVQPKRLDPLAYTFVATDLLLTSGLVYLTGGAHSGFASLFGVVVLGAALVVGPRPTLVAAGLAPILYVGLALGLANGWLPLPPDQSRDVYVHADADFSLAILRNLVGLLLVGGLAALLSDRLHQTAGALVRATESAADSARLTEDIVRSLASGLITTDLDGVVRTMNVAGGRMLGAAPEALIGTALDRTFPGAAPDVGTRNETTAMRPDGSTFPVGYSRTELVSHDGVVRGSLVLFQDLSELAELRDKAERAERLAALGRVAAGLAHEIRNPLGAISGCVELVRDAGVLGQEDRGLLDGVLREVDRLNELVTTMLEVGKPTLPERRVVQLRELAREVIALAGRQPAAAGVRLTLVAEEPIEASIDPAQIRQVLWNLVKNAVQFAPSGTEITVTLARADGRARLTVRDHGPGVAAADAPHVFDMFFTRRRHGVGLGLALAKQLVEAHGGRITLETVAPAGAVFVVEIDTLPSAPTVSG